MFGYNVPNWNQENGMGAELDPGCNQPAAVSPDRRTPTACTFDEFSPVGELRLEAAYYLTQAFALKAGYTGMYVGNIRGRRRRCGTTCRTWATAIPARRT